MLNSYKNIKRAKRINFFVILLLLNGFIQIVFAKPTPGLSIFEILSGILLIFTAFCFVLKQLLDKKPFSFFNENRIFILIIFFILLSFFLNFLVSQKNGIAIWEWLKAGYGYFNLVFILIVLGEVKERVDIKSIFLGLALIIFISISLELIEISMLTEIEIQGKRQIEGIFKEFRPTLATILVGLCITIGVVYIWTSFRFVHKLIFVIFIILILIRMVLTRSKFLLSFTLISVIVAFCLSWLSGRFHRKTFLRNFQRSTIVIIILLSIVIIAVGSKGIDAFIESFGYRFSRIEASTSKRIAEYKAAIEIFSENPILGNGFGSNIYFYRPDVGEKRYSHIHNIFIQILKDGGLLLFFLYVSFLFIYFSIVLKLIRRSRDPYDLSVLLSSILGIIGLLVYAQVSTILNTQTANYFFSILVGIALSVSNITKVNELKE